MKQLSNQALAWLSLIFEERFGYSFNLKSVEDGISMTLVNQIEGEIVFPHTFPEFFESCSDIPCTIWDAEAEGWESVLKEPLPAPGITHLASKLIEYDQLTSAKIYIKYDIPGLTYWMLNRIEEIGRTDLDNHNRFPAINSHAYKYGYLDRPIVDEWLDILKQIIKRVWPDLKLKKHQFSIKVSHDVDIPSRFAFSTPAGVIKSMVSLALKNKNIKLALMAPFIYLGSKNKIHPLDPYNTFDWLMSISEKNNIKSAFYFICGRTDESKDALYEPDHLIIKQMMVEMYRRGHEIGLHPSYKSFNNPDQIKFEAQRLKEICKGLEIKQSQWGGRMHFLRWSHPTTLQAWSDAGMSYESTLGYADQSGFRCGTCHEYAGFNPLTETILNIKIRPLIVMECTVIDKRYLGLGYTNESFQIFADLKNKCKIVEGNFTLLWHNNRLFSSQEREMYEKVLMV